MITENKYSEKELTLGRAYRTLREAKGFTQKEAAGGDMVLADISNFETGKSMPNINHFFAMLENITVNPDEYHYVRNDLLLKEKDVLLYSAELSTTYITHNVAKLKSILENIDNVSQIKGEKRKYKLDRIRVEAVLSMVDPSWKVSEDDINYLENYFRNLEEWGQYEILLLEHTAALFDPVVLFSLANNTLSPTQALIKLSYLERTLISTVLNVIDVFINKEAFSFAEKFITYLEKNNIHDYYMIEKLTLIYDKARLAFLKDNDEASLDTMKKCQEVFAFCDCYNMANTIEHEIASLTNKTEKANKSEQH